jgi:ERCC4-type nuclease
VSAPTIVADVHEEQSGIPSLLETLGAVVERASLSAGDYLVGADTTEVLRASPDEWLDVPGVGQERARLLAEAVTHRWHHSS